MVAATNRRTPKSNGLTRYEKCLWRNTENPHNKTERPAPTAKIASLFKLKKSEVKGKKKSGTKKTSPRNNKPRAVFAPFGRASLCIVSPNHSEQHSPFCQGESTKSQITNPKQYLIINLTF